jgi:hypothetical protein
MPTPLRSSVPTLAAGKLSAGRWAYPAALAGAVIFASGQSHVAGSGWFIGIDKLSHFAVFGLLATLVLRAPGPCQARAWRAAAAVSLFGLCDEWRQSFTPGRFVEFADWVADTVGALVAVFVYQTWPAYRRLLEFRLPLGLARRAVPPPAP